MAQVCESVKRRFTRAQELTSGVKRILLDPIILYTFSLKLVFSGLWRARSSEWPQAKVPGLNRTICNSLQNPISQMN